MRISVITVIVAICLATGLLPAQTPVTDAVRSYRPRALADQLIKSGVLLNAREFSDIPLAFTVLDSASNPVPGAKLVIEYADSTAVLQADSSGQVMIVFDSLALRRNPLLRPASPDLRIDLSLSISRGRSNQYHRINVINLSKLHRLKAGEDLVWCPPEYDSAGARLAAYIPVARELIRRVTGFEPVRWGTVLSDSSLPVAASPAVIRVDGKPCLLFPFSLKDESPYGWCLGNLVQWAERTISDKLPSADAQTRWVQTGITTYLEYRIITELGRNDVLRRILADKLRRKLGSFLDGLQAAKPEDVTMESELYEWSDIISSGAIATRAMPSYVARPEWVLKTDLLKWHAVDPSHPVSDPDLVQYELAAGFWWDLAQRYGESIIPEFLARAQAINARHSQQFLTILTDLTGGLDVRSRLRDFNITNLEDATQQRLNELR